MPNRLSRVQKPQEITQAVVRKQMLGTCQPGVDAEMACGDQGAGRVGQLPTAFRSAFSNAVQAFAQITFNCSHIHLEVPRQPMLVNNVSLMQLRQDLG
ncbi:hypothetical protein A1D30_19850 [Acidovorax sp. GW101-3H11]|nr:hypothetical protein A1D30_19850 [Acidovorax sp. GW101-3H11]